MQQLSVAALVSLFAIGCKGGPEQLYGPTEPARVRVLAGPNRVSGRAFLITERGRVYGGRVEVNLDPDSERTRLWFTTHIVQQDDLRAQEFMDAESLQSRRTVKTDADGRFEFNDVAPGNYFVTARVHWYVRAGFMVALLTFTDFQKNAAMAYGEVSVAADEAIEMEVTRPGEVFEPPKFYRQPY